MSLVHDQLQMGSEGVDYDNDIEPSSTPKLSLFSFPGKVREPPPGMSTPPIHTLASIPFQWEEAPGKPRPSMMKCTDEQSSSKPKPAAARCLELPPRLLTEANKITNNVSMSSPTTVLDGPEVGRSLSYTSSFRIKGGSFRITANNPPEIWGKKEKVLFGSSRWGSFKKNTNNFDISASAGLGGDDGGGSGGDCGNSGGGTNVKVTRVRKRSMSFLSPKSHTSSHMWTNIYESFKQVVPWRRRQEKLRKDDGS